MAGAVRAADGARRLGGGGDSVARRVAIQSFTRHPTGGGGGGGVGDAPAGVDGLADRRDGLGRGRGGGGGAERVLIAQRVGGAVAVGVAGAVDGRRGVGGGRARRVAGNPLAEHRPRRRRRDGVGGI